MTRKMLQDLLYMCTFKKQHEDIEEYRAYKCTEVA